MFVDQKGFQIHFKRSDRKEELPDLVKHFKPLFSKAAKVRLGWPC